MEKIKALAKDTLIQVEASKQNYADSQYFIYNGMIWKWRSKQGVGKSYRLLGERESAGLRVVLEGMTPELKSVMWVYPQGHIPL